MIVQIALGILLAIAILLVVGMLIMFISMGLGDEDGVDKNRSDVVRHDISKKTDEENKLYCATLNDLWGWYDRGRISGVKLSIEDINALDDDREGFNFNYMGGVYRVEYAESALNPYGYEIVLYEHNEIVFGFKYKGFNYGEPIITTFRKSGNWMEVLLVLRSELGGRLDNAQKGCEKLIADGEAVKFNK